MNECPLDKRYLSCLIAEAALDDSEASSTDVSAVRKQVNKQTAAGFYGLYCRSNNVGVMTNSDELVMGILLLSMNNGRLDSISV